MPATRDHVVVYDIAVDGRPLSVELELAVVGVVVDQRLGVPALASVTLHDPQRSVLEQQTFKLGRALTVKARMGGQPAVSLFDGEITALEVEYDTGGMVAVVRAYDRSHRLSHGRRTRSFLNSSYADIVRKVAREHGLSVEADATPVVHEHVLQCNESDLDFLHGLAREIGYDLAVSGRQLTFAKRAPASGAPQPGDLQTDAALQLVMGENLQSLRAIATAAEQVTRAEVRGWDVKRKQAVVSSKRPPKTLGATNGVPDSDYAVAAGTATAVATATPYQVQAEADAAGEGFAEEVASVRTEIEGVALGEPTLSAGTTISIGQAGSAFDGKYTVTAARHVYEPGEGYLTEFGVTGRADRTLRGLVAGVAASPAASARGSVDGVVVGIVTNNKDPEGLGRVKVKFPWLDEQTESAWARPVQLIAGPSYGALIIPEVNDEVLVAFEHDDPNRPYLIGSLYNGKDKPQKPGDQLIKSGKVAQRRIETPTLNRLVFFDHRGTKEGVTLRTGDDKFFLDLDKTNTRIVLSSNGDVAIEAKTGKVEITSQQDMVLKSKANLTLEGTNKTTIKGATVEVAAQATMKLQASGPLEAKGAVIKLN